MSTYRLQVREPRGTLHDVFVTAEDGSPTAQLEEEIEATGFRAKPLGVNGRSLSAAPTVGELGLEHGDIIQCGRLGTRCVRRRPPAPTSSWSPAPTPAAGNASPRGSG